MRFLVLIVFLVSCSAQSSAHLEMEEKIEQHSLILSAISEYVSRLQESGVLPKPEAKE